EPRIQTGKERRSCTGPNNKGNRARKDVEGKKAGNVFIGVQNLHGKAVAQRDGQDSGLDQERDSQPRRGNRNYPPKQYLGADACRRSGPGPVLQESAKKM